MTTTDTPAPAITQATLEALRERYAAGEYTSDPNVLALIDTLLAERATHAALVARIRGIEVQTPKDLLAHVQWCVAEGFGRLLLSNELPPVVADLAALAALVAEVGEQ